MDTAMSHAGRPAFHTIRETAWLLGCDTDSVCRAIRTGRLRAVRRRSRLVVPTHELIRVLQQADSVLDHEEAPGGDRDEPRQ